MLITGQMISLKDLRGVLLNKERGRNEETGYCLGLLGPPRSLCCRGLYDMSRWEPQGLLDPSAQGNQMNMYRDEI